VNWWNIERFSLGIDGLLELGLIVRLEELEREEEEVVAKGDIVFCGTWDIDWRAWYLD
jgi:hypothetical protein